MLSSPSDTPLLDEVVLPRHEHVLTPEQCKSPRRRGFVSRWLNLGPRSSRSFSVAVRRPLRSVMAPFRQRLDSGRRGRSRGATSSRAALSEPAVLTRKRPSSLLFLDHDHDDESVIDKGIEDFVEDGLAASGAVGATSAKSGKSRLLEIVSLESRRVSATEKEDRQRDLPQESSSLLSRGTGFVRKSIRRITITVRSSEKDRDKKSVTRPRSSTSGKRTGDKSSSKKKTSGCTESQDSGLGEDSEFDTTSPRTPTLGAQVLRLNSANHDYNVAEVGALAVKKHVMIREPEPVAEKSGPMSRKATEQSRSRERARIFPGSAHIPSYHSTPDKVRGSVSAQWDRLLDCAYLEVLHTVADCESDVVRLVFARDVEESRRILQKHSTSEDLAVLIHSVYKILFFNWMRRGRTERLAVILHCVQRFLIVFVDVADGLDMEDRLTLARGCRALLRTSEARRYADLDVCLLRTRRVFVDLWCALLCVPFNAA